MICVARESTRAYVLFVSEALATEGETNMTAEQAITQSAQSESTVTLPYSEALATDLLLECEENDDGDYWGTTESGAQWRVRLEAAETQQAYTYSVFDADPDASSGGVWPAHEDVEIEAESDEEAIEAVRDVLDIEAVGLNVADGYDIGQRLYALLWSADGTNVAKLTHELTAEDLGVEASVAAEAE